MGKFGLPVGTQVFVAEAFGDLEVFFHASDHKELFEHLGGLGEGVELAGVYAAGNEVISGAFGGTFGEKRGIHFEEALLVEVFSHAETEVMAKSQGFLHGGTTQVQVAVLHSDVFGDGIALIDGEGEGIGAGAEDMELAGHHFDFTCGHIQVNILGGAQAHFALYGHDVLIAELLGDLQEVWVGIGDNDLGGAMFIGEGKEEDFSDFSDILDPSDEGDVLIIFLSGKLVAVVGAFCHRWGSFLRRDFFLFFG